MLARLCYFSQRWTAEYEAAAARGLHPHHLLQLQQDLARRHGRQGGAEGRREPLEQQALQLSRLRLVLLLPPPCQRPPRVLEKISNPGILPK